MSRLRRLFKSHQAKTSKLRTRSRKLIAERLEHRRVLAAYINEIHLGQSDLDFEEQYIELRGEPNATFPDGSYFVGIESADGVDELGNIHSVLDLSGRTFGSNGLMAFVATLKIGGSNGYPVDPNATVFSGAGNFITIDGFSADRNREGLHTGSSTYLLIESGIAPVLADDIDANDDGTPDGAYLNWTIQDGFTNLPWVENLWTQSAYAPIVFSEDGVGNTFLPGSTVIRTEQQAYTARIGSSTGYSDHDWLSANTTDFSRDPFDFEIVRGVHGTATHEEFSGREIDHVGAPNWFGSISGSVFEDLNRDGDRQAGEPAFTGATVSAYPGEDANVWEVIEPDDFADMEDLSNVSQYATLTNTDVDNSLHSFVIRARDNASGPGKVFAHEGVGFFNTIRKLRIDFYSPARGVAVSVTGGGGTTTGVLELYNDNDELLESIETGILASDQVQDLELIRPTNDIAYAITYSKDLEFGRFDNLRLLVNTGDSTTVDSEGSYSLNRLLSDTYTVKAEGSQLYNPAIEQITVAGASSHAGVELGVTDRYPVLEDQTFEVGELAADDTIIATLPIRKGYLEQQFNYEILSGNTDDLFSIISSTNSLRLNRAELNFEETTSYTLEIQLTDKAIPELSDTATLEIQVLNENDAPVVIEQSVTVAENSENGTEVTTMEATDEDVGLNVFTWSITSGNTGDAFEIDPSTGVVSVNDSSILDYETNRTFELIVQATDSGTPAASGTGLLSITLGDVNDPPVINEQVPNIVENTAPGMQVAQLLYTDPDHGQTATWSVIDGTGQDHFELSAFGQLVVAEGAVLDFETQPQYTLNVRVTDSGDPALTDEHEFTLNLVDINDAPTFADMNLSIAENSDESAEVGIVEVTDQDAGQTVTLAITGGDDADKFNLDSATGLLTVAAGAVLDHETTGQAFVEITATDNGAPVGSTSSLIQISIADINEGPSIASDNISVDENSSAGASAGAVEGSDPDDGDVLTFEILEQSENWLSIDAAGNLTVMEDANIDFEAGIENVVSVKVTDQGGLSSQSTFTVTVNDQNDAPVLVNPLPDASVIIGQALMYEIPADTFADQDAGDTLRFAATDGLGFSLPSWLTFDSTALTISGTPTQANLGTLDVRVSASDPSRARATDTFQITVEPEPFPWHNSAEPFDANSDGFVSPIDALIIVNYLNSNPGSEVPSGSQPEFGFLDANKDNFVTPIDALIVINELNNPAGDGEFAEQNEHWLQFDFQMESEEDKDDELLLLLAQERSVYGPNF